MPFTLEDAKEVVTPDMYDWMVAERDTPELQLARCLACVLHSRQCSYNHTDGCGWFYNEADSEFSRGLYLKQAVKLIDEHGREWATAIVSAFLIEHKAHKEISVLMERVKR